MTSSQTLRHARYLLFIICCFQLTNPTCTFGQQQLFELFPQSLSPQVFDEQGYSVAVNDDYRIVGKPNADFKSLQHVGAVEVYTAENSHLLTLHNPEPDIGSANSSSSQFGRSVAITGSFVAVGAPFHIENGLERAGVVWVFDLESANPLEPIYKLDAPVEPFGRYFGELVVADNDRIVVGTPRFNIDGKVYVYDLNSGQPTVPTFLLNGVTEDFDRNDSTIAISGDSLLVGLQTRALLFDLGSATPGDSTMTIPIPPATLGNVNFGQAISIDENIAVIASDRFAFVYDLASADPDTPVFELIDPESSMSSSKFGSTITVGTSNGKVIVGEFFDNDPKIIVPGAAFFYDLSSPTPKVAVATMVDPQRRANGAFGFAIAMSGDTCLIGSPGGQGSLEPGRADVFDLASGTPQISVGSVTTPTFPSSRQLFGWSLAASDQYLIAGAPEEGAYVGAVFVFETGKGASTPRSPSFVLTDPTPQFTATFGISVAIDQEIVVVNSAGSDAYVFDLGSATPEVPLYELIIPLTSNPSPHGDVAVSGNFVFVAQCYPSNSSFGEVHVFDLGNTNPTTPIMTLQNPNGLNGLFGLSISAEGSKFAIGSTDGDENNAVYLYDLNSPTPDEPILTITDPEPGPNYFGWRIAMENNLLVVGSPFRQNSSGGAFVYDLDSANPTEPISFLAGNPADAIGTGYDVEIRNSTAYLAAYPRAPLTHATVTAYDNFVPNAVPTRTFLMPSNAADSLAVNDEMLFVGNRTDDFLNFYSGSVAVFDVAKDNIGANSLTVNKGIVKSGGVDELAESDNQDFSVTRDPILIQSAVVFEAKTITSFANPSSLTLTFEASVFARGNIAQKISILNYETGEYEVLDSRAASRLIDQTVSVAATGDVSRFVESGTQCVQAQIEFLGDNNRVRFTANCDQLRWEIE